jgi:hypothetical protein
MIIILIDMAKDINPIRMISVINIAQTILHNTQVVKPIDVTKQALTTCRTIQIVLTSVTPQVLHINPIYLNAENVTQIASITCQMTPVVLYHLNVQYRIHAMKHAKILTNVIKNAHHSIDVTRAAHHSIDVTRAAHHSIDVTRAVHRLMSVIRVVQHLMNVMKAAHHLMNAMKIAHLLISVMRVAHHLTNVMKIALRLISVTKVAHHLMNVTRNAKLTILLYVLMGVLTSSAVMLNVKASSTSHNAKDARMNATLNA